jgi:dihydroorotase
MQEHIIKGAQIINEGKITASDVHIRKGHIERIDPSFNVTQKVNEINADGLYLMPGIIDDQVHFREPGLTHKATIYTEAKAGVAGGVTSFMEMPNTNPPALSRELLEAKYMIGDQTSLANYSFFMGVSNDNFDDLAILFRDQEQKTLRNICGIKIFMGSSTGNMLVDNPSVLERIFAESNMLIATHCEDEARVRERNAHYKEKYGDKLDASYHPIIRDVEACYKSSSYAVGLAKKYNTRLHVLHISTAKETELFENKLPLKDKRITAEACVHHLWFDADDYTRLGNKIKCNPAIKDKSNKPEILAALLDDKIDIIATDHAPHTAEEKAKAYIDAPAGLPLIQHSLNIMLELYHQGKISLEKIVEKMCHAPADCFRVNERGYLREGYHADVVLFDTKSAWTVSPENILHKCGWSPFEGYQFKGRVHKTIVNGHVVYDNGVFDETVRGQRIAFKG